MDNQVDIVDASGHLEIWKVFPGGREEKVFDDHNVITSGMGVGLAMLFAGSGADTIADYQIKWFQLGVSGDYAIRTNYDSSQYSLVSALGQTDETMTGGVGGTSGHYGVGAIMMDQHDLMSSNGDRFNTGVPHWFVYIPENAIRKTSDNSVTYALLVDREICNGHTLNEIGLFMHDPLAAFLSAGGGGQLPRSPLVAYRPFVNIKKSADFALVFRWTLSF